MKLEQLKTLEIKRVGNTDEGITAGIDESSLPFVFELVSKQLYSNPIGSVIREITSNCFDSHIEAGVDEPVIISKSYDSDEGWSIEFKDVGVGLSPERVQKIYMNYFSSTKRETNNQIGGFGIGSKTPLAYTDMFYITTIFDGIKYEYIFHKGEEKPTLDELGQEETEEHNGTTIRIVIEDGDTTKFYDELKLQLTYFDNVYFKGWGISNDYDIYEGRNFKFRSDIDQFKNTIHLCIGNVRYPIDFTKVAVPHEFRAIPVAVKFDIGELPIVPSREAIRYSAEVAAKINEKIKLVVAEILEIFEKQNPIIEDLGTFKEALRTKPKITFDASKGHDLYIWSGSTISKSFKFKPIADIGIKKTPSEMFFHWEIIGHICNGIRTQQSNTPSIDFILSNGYLIVDKEDKFSEYTNINISEEFFSGNIYLIRKRKLEYDKALDQIGMTKKLSNELGKAKVVASYFREMNKIVREKSKGNYQDYRPSDQWIAEHKKRIIESTNAFKRKKNQEVFVRDVHYAFQGKDMKVWELQNRTGILIWGFKEEKELLQEIWDIVITSRFRHLYQEARHYSRGNKHYDKFRKAFMVLQCSKQAAIDIQGASKTIHCVKFLKTKFFQEIVDNAEFKYRLPKRDSLKEAIVKDYSSELGVLRRLGKYYIDRPITIRNHEFTANPNLLNLIENFNNKYKFNLPLRQYIDSEFVIQRDKEFTEYYLPILKKWARDNKIRIANHFYLKTDTQLAEEQRDRDFKLSLYNLLDSFKDLQVIYLLTYNQTNTNNGTDQSEGCTEEGSSTEQQFSEADRSESNSDIGWRQQDESESSRSNRERDDLEESSSISEKTDRDSEESDYETDEARGDEEEGNEGESSSTG